MYLFSKLPFSLSHISHYRILKHVKVMKILELKQMEKCYAKHTKLYTFKYICIYLSLRINTKSNISHVKINQLNCGRKIQRIESTIQNVQNHNIIFSRNIILVVNKIIYAPKQWIVSKIQKDSSFQFLVQHLWHIKKYIYFAFFQYPHAPRLLVSHCQENISNVIVMDVG